MDLRDDAWIPENHLEVGPMEEPLVLEVFSDYI